VVGDEGNAYQRIAEGKLNEPLRNQMASAPLTDEKRFVLEMEAAYRSMWQDWLKTEQPSTRT
jgi:predicted O-linked N-acetylglucosamine transferase (SPINDLY family)